MTDGRRLFDRLVQLADADVDSLRQIVADINGLLPGDETLERAMTVMNANRRPLDPELPLVDRLLLSCVADKQSLETLAAELAAVDVQGTPDGELRIEGALSLIQKQLTTIDLLDALNRS